MTAKILSTLKQRVKDFKLIPGNGGCFEVRVNGDLIYSKLKTGQFPDEDEILDQISSRK